MNNRIPQDVVQESEVPKAPPAFAPVDSAPAVKAPVEDSVADKIAAAELELEEKQKAFEAKLAAHEREVEKLNADKLAVKAMGGKLESVEVKHNGSPLAAKEQLLDAELDAAFEAGKGSVMVEAITRGIYPNCVRRARGDKFKVHSKELFSTSWMKLVK